MEVYKITNLVNNKAYIGITRTTFWKRYNCRPDWWNVTLNLGLINGVKKYGSDMFKVEIIDYGIDIWDLNNLEKYYIKLYNTLSPNGYNFTTGGESDYIVSEETKKRASEIRKGRPGTGKNIKGHKKSKECIDKIRKTKKIKYIAGTLKPWNKGIKTGRPTDLAILNSATAHKKPVKCMDLNGNILKIYSGMVDTKLDGFDPTRVCLCCKYPDKHKIYKNLKWAYV